MKLKYFTNILCLCIINIFILLSKYPVEIKAFAICLGSIIFILCLVKRQVIKLWIVIYSMLMTLLNIICFFEVHYIHIVTYNDTYNKNTKWMTTQTDYVWNTGNSEAILSSIFRNKDIYVMSEEKYEEYIRYFSKNLYFLENQIDYGFQFQYFQEKFIPLGRMSPQSTPWLWNDDMRDKLTELRGDFDTTPRIYVSSENVADKQKLVAVSDENYNLYIWSYEEFKELLQGEGKRQ